MIITRRRFLKQSAVGLVGLGSLGLAPQRGAAEASESALDGLPEGARLSAMLDTLSGKRPLIKRSYRPPNFETPLAYLDQVFTPNDAFFVRYHHAVIPPINASQWRLRIDGEAAARRDIGSAGQRRAVGGPLQRRRLVELPRHRRRPRALEQRARVDLARGRGDHHVLGLEISVSDPARTSVPV